VSDREDDVRRRLEALIQTLWSTRGFEHNVKIYELLRDYIKQEDNLINQRLTWILTIHGFLYATYGLTIHKNLEIAAKMAADLTDDKNRRVAAYLNGSILCTTLWEMHLFLILISLIGFFISYFGARSINAAYESATQVRDVLEKEFSTRTDKYNLRVGRKIRVIRRIEVGDSTTGSAKLPDISGGGSEYLERRGFTASRAIPYVLAFGWVVAIIFETLYIWINIDYMSCFMK
jgi:hypothetical protein